MSPALYGNVFLELLLISLENAVKKGGMDEITTKEAEVLLSKLDGLNRQALLWEPISAELLAMPMLDEFEIFPHKKNQETYGKKK